MRYLSLLFVIFQGCCWFGCDEDLEVVKDRNGIIIKTPYLWKHPLYYTFNAPGNPSVWAGANLYYDKGYFVGSLPEKRKTYYEFRSIETGKLIWKIANDVVNSRGYPFGIRLGNLTTYQWQHYVVTTPYYPLCFNLKTGQVQWRLKDVKYWKTIDGGFKDKVFFSKKDERGKYVFYEADILTGSHQEFLRFKDGNSGALAHFIDKKGDLILVITYYKNTSSHLGLYNYTQKKWLYRDIPTEAGGWIRLYKEKDKIFLLGMQSFACHRLSTGEEIWSDSSYNQFDNAGPAGGRCAMIGNKLVVAMGSDFLMCLNMDANYKDVIWENHRYNIGNSVSQFYALNGIVYFADKGSGRIVAINPHTGKLLWYLESPDLQEYGSGAFFKGDIWVIPGKDGKKGRIITSTYRSGVCYEAIR